MQYSMMTDYSDLPEDHYSFNDLHLQIRELEYEILNAPLSNREREQLESELERLRSCL